MQPSKDILGEVTKLWKLKGEPVFVRKLANWVYKSEIDNVFIRITETHHRNQNQLEAELHWIEYLYERDIDVVQPLFSNEHKLVHELKDTTERFFVSVFKEAEGIQCRQPEDFTPHLMQRWGSLFGKMHKATKTYTPPSSAKTRAQCDEDKYHQNIIDQISPDEPLFYETFQKTEALFKRLPRHKDSFGLIHCDIHPGNFHYVPNGRITLYDFDDCVYHWFAYDIATTVFTIKKYVTDGAAIWSRYEPLFWEAYEAENQMSSESIEAIDEFFHYRCLLVYFYLKDAVRHKTVQGEAVVRFNEIADTYKQYLKSLLTV